MRGASKRTESNGRTQTPQQTVHGMNRDSAEIAVKEVSVPPEVVDVAVDSCQGGIPQKPASASFF